MSSISPAQDTATGDTATGKPTLGNAPEWTVSELSSALKRTLEDAFGHVRLRGEIFGYRGPHGSGHAYFCLKDKDARLDAVIWRNTLQRMRFKPEEGLEVVATGRITTFPGKSAYQIIVDSLEPAGAGALMALLDERRRRLAAEGLFAEARKRKPPFLPRVIGVVTSPTGAVIRDILHRLTDRFPRRVIVWPVRVQGETCGEEVAAAIAGLNALTADGPIPRPDVVIVARGGGSIEDLWGFNEEAVVRATVASGIPIIAAIGHETDWTLIDLAADLRAPTPTGAAELAVPVRSELLAQLYGLASRHDDAIRRALEGRRGELRSVTRALPTSDGLLARPRQRLDLATAKLRPALRANAREHERRLHAASAALLGHTPRVALARWRERLSGLSERLRAGRESVARAERLRIARCHDRLAELAARSTRAVAGGLDQRQRHLEARANLLASLGYRAVLARGYALVRDERGGPVSRAADAAPGLPVTIEFADGRRRAQIEGARARRRAEPLVQPNLFDI